MRTLLQTINVVHKTSPVCPTPYQHNVILFIIHSSWPGDWPNNNPLPRLRNYPLTPSIPWQNPPKHPQIPPFTDRFGLFVDRRGMGRKKEQPHCPTHAKRRICHQQRLCRRYRIPSLKKSFSAPTLTVKLCCHRFVQEIIRVDFLYLEDLLFRNAYIILIH